MCQGGGIEQPPGEASMGQASTIGLDIAKWVFQAHGADATGRVVFRKRLVRAKVLEFFAVQPRCLVALEACGGAHYWARELGKLGHTVRLIRFPPVWAALPCSDGMNDASITEYGVVSDCLGCQAEYGSWARTSRALALRRTRSLWARAIRITFFGLPARVSRRWKAAKSGLCRRTSSATTNRIERMPLRPPRTGRLPPSLPLSRA